MIFTDRQRRYLAGRDLGRLATIGPAGAPQNHPVAFRVLDATVEIGGPDLAASRKARNIAADPRVSLVIDDNAPEAVGPGGQRGRGIEVRGRAELVELDEPLMAGFSAHVLRIHPRRVLAWNVDGPGRNSRDVPE